MDSVVFLVLLLYNWKLDYFWERINSILNHIFKYCELKVVNDVFINHIKLKFYLNKF